MIQKTNSGVLRVFQIPVLLDNYIYIIRHELLNLTGVIDPALPQPVIQFLEQNQWHLDFILNTHHHLDHVGGNKALIAHWSPKVMGYGDDSKRIPGINVFLKEGEKFYFGDCLVEVLFLPGHTLGHIAYLFKRENILFCGDTLFGMGCGRLLEGTHEQMFNSLNQIKALSSKTTIYCAHEYTEKNGNFALSIDSKNSQLKKRLVKVQSMRKQGLATVPFPLSEELKTNPFLRVNTVHEFTKIRLLRDSF